MVDFILDITAVKSLGETEEEHTKNVLFIYKFIIDKYAFLTIEEVKEAFKMYVANQFDIKVFRMLDCVVVGEVLTTYIEFRNASLFTYKPVDNTPRLEIITNSAKEQINKDAANRVFNEFKETKTLPDGITYVYDTLVEYGIIKVYSDKTPNLKKYYDSKMLQATEELKNEKRNEIANFKKGVNVSAINSLKNALIQIEKGTSTNIILRTKKIILKEFFIQKMIDGETTIF